MRRAARVDKNQKQIVQEIRAAGYTVQHLHMVGEGCPDILVGGHGVNFLFEIKDPSQPPSKRKLTPDEMEWHLNWNGQVEVIKTAHEALEIIKALSG